MECKARGRANRATGRRPASQPHARRDGPRLAHGRVPRDQTARGTVDADVHWATVIMENSTLGSMACVTSLLSSLIYERRVQIATRRVSLVAHALSGSHEHAKLSTMLETKESIALHVGRRLSGTRSPFEKIRKLKGPKSISSTRMSAGS